MTSKKEGREVQMWGHEQALDLAQFEWQKEAQRREWGTGESRWATELQQEKWKTEKEAQMASDLGEVSRIQGLMGSQSQALQEANREIEYLKRIQPLDIEMDLFERGFQLVIM